jgi:hypothetical protein
MFSPVNGFGSGSRCLDGEVREAKPEKMKNLSFYTAAYGTATQQKSPVSKKKGLKYMNQ